MKKDSVEVILKEVREGILSQIGLEMLKMNITAEEIAVCKFHKNRGYYIGYESIANDSFKLRFVD